MDVGIPGSYKDMEIVIQQKSNLFNRLEQISLFLKNSNSYQKKKFKMIIDLTKF